MTYIYEEISAFAECTSDLAVQRDFSHLHRWWTFSDDIIPSDDVFRQVSSSIAELLKRLEEVHCWRNRMVSQPIGVGHPYLGQLVFPGWAQAVPRLVCTAACCTFPGGVPVSF
ncbi:hypothetical protein, variant 3 [Verruconis gallopava]|uniref:Uncharacterized protein n=1 Tax=Verruconis gallopava TaxID=253628 RepID=A0A0D1ZVR9_9PEZI|nr:uncharacterized protein PV09_09667 [Verruconis gallopava]XP_016208401.1 hypothetical protein, variant 1 [Verruconis gallopava]XP_016208402.1 hypothetical protein, variant 2 [Verruconis gallopava]XP_016208403.1 hypothetical protein, variant 3 [Verruconis gallopava]KIV98530.1 hypothetical protein PV09_09667 [Verruconis gallopava]KIV98531.1 hypothetical protein, variant 1 [Verruconis gallopava]KIV98532.1 hypothetical protein, variant 2 [Verruconis gallopava]KIV98533.1 hypothetical protein, v